MPERGFKTITVTAQLYQRVQQRAKKENRKAASYVSEILETMLYVEDKFLNYVPFLELVSLNSNEVIIRDNKNDRIVGVKAKATDGGKVKFYCEIDGNTDYCPHTAFAAALPQVRHALRR
ncbi:MAG: hypothetical protein ACLQEQ_04595 [Nitrososphaerales archaeon]